MLAMVPRNPRERKNPWLFLPRPEALSSWVCFHRACPSVPVPGQNDNDTIIHGENTTHGHFPSQNGTHSLSSLNDIYRVPDSTSDTLTVEMWEVLYKEGKGGSTVVEGDWARVAEPTTQYTDGVLQNCTPGTHINRINQCHPNTFNKNRTKHKEYVKKYREHLKNDLLSPISKIMTSR